MQKKEVKSQIPHYTMTFAKQPIGFGEEMENKAGREWVSVAESFNMLPSIIVQPGSHTSLPYPVP